ncbi:hypothetical protein BGZ70_003799, partial [Mortierella alpina]
PQFFPPFLSVNASQPHDRHSPDPVLSCGGEATCNAFSVKAPSSATVGDLKDLIKTKKTPRFDDVDADELTIWRVSIAIIDDNDELPILLNIVPDSERKKLGPATRLFKVFF